MSKFLVKLAQRKESEDGSLTIAVEICMESLPSEIDVSILSLAEHRILIRVWELFCRYRITEIERFRFIKGLIWSYRLHTKTKRKSKESYFIHDLRCVSMALAGGLPIVVAISMFAHEFKEDDEWTDEQLIEEFGQEITDVVIPLSKPKKIYDSREARLRVHLQNLKEAKPYVRWIVRICKKIDRKDNTHDTAGLSSDDQRQLFDETEIEFVPWFSETQDEVPRKFRWFDAVLQNDIENACANYRQGHVLAVV